MYIMEAWFGSLDGVSAERLSSRREAAEMEIDCPDLYDQSILIVAASSMPERI
jgi:hypothetical protein